MRRGHRGIDEKKGVSHLERAALWVGLAVGITALCSFFFGGHTFKSLTDSIWSAQTSDRGRGVQLISAIPVNRREEYKTSGAGTYMQTKASMPRIEISVKNEGAKTVWLKQARIVITDSAELPMCIATGGGDTPLSQPYWVNLPLLPAPKERLIRHSLHVEIPPNQGDRFRLYFRTQWLFSDRHLYALHVRLITDRPGDTVDAGHFILGIPGPVPRAGQLYLPTDESKLKGVPGEGLASTWCYLRNIAEVKRLVDDPGRRSETVAALSQLGIANGWVHYADRSNARSAVKDLMRGGESAEGPVLAAFAAERTGDKRLMEGTRERVAAFLLKRAESELSKKGAFAELADADVRRALILHPSPKARRLLLRAGVRVEAQEEQAGTRHSSLSG